MLVPYLWEFRVRVALALAFPATAKLANVGVPLILKEVVDSLDARTAMLVLPSRSSLLTGSSFSTDAFAELRDVVFVRVTHAPSPGRAHRVPSHRKPRRCAFTGAPYRRRVARIERGKRGISTLLTYMLFSIVPVILEFSLGGGHPPH